MLEPWQHPSNTPSCMSVWRRSVPRVHYPSCVVERKKEENLIEAALEKWRGLVSLTWRQSRQAGAFRP